jgi:hypothetical protein
MLGKEKEVPTVDLCVCGLFNDAVGSSDYISSNGAIIKEGWIGKDRKENGHSLIQCTIPSFTWTD